MVRCPQISLMLRRQTGMRFNWHWELIAHAVFTRFPLIVWKRYLLKINSTFIYLIKVFVRAINSSINNTSKTSRDFYQGRRKLNSILRIQYTSDFILSTQRQAYIWFNTIAIVNILRLCSHIKNRRISWHRPHRTTNTRTSWYFFVVSPRWNIFLEIERVSRTRSSRQER